ncbi:MAG: hypothetical protein HC820_00565 [Hydrococcus sp. RM1_1_31]|nr:hypothetical protein [Hydrococcus sp. RM1_1_31]
MIGGQLFFLSLWGLYVLGAIVFWGLISWALLSKAGYRGSFLWIMLLLMLLTPVGIILFAVLPFPIERQLNRLRTKRHESEPYRTIKVDNVENELNQLKGQMGLTQMKPKKR